VIRLPVPVPPKRKNHPKKLTWERVHQIRLARAKGAQPRDLALANGVCVETIRHICSGKTWRDGTDSISRGIWPYKLTQETARQLRAERAQGVTLAVLAKRYGVTEACASRVCLGRCWKDGSEEATKGLSFYPKKLTWDEVRQIRSMRRITTLKTIARLFGVSESLIGRICQGYMWKDGDWENPYPPGSFHKMTPQKLLRLRELWMVNTPRKAIAKELGVSHSTVTHIINGLTWRKEWENEQDPRSEEVT
jgi:DNA invertase Pin-like site-specific DNA recombinase